MCYTHFHVCSGLELAIDNFCLRLFKDQDMEGALSEWTPGPALRFGTGSSHEVLLSNAFDYACLATAPACIRAQLLPPGMCCLQHSGGTER